MIRIVSHHLFDWPQAVSWSNTQDAIVGQVRAPRALLGVVVGARLVLFWLLDSLANAGWSLLAIAAVAVALAVLLMWGRHLDALAAG